MNREDVKEILASVIFFLFLVLFLIFYFGIQDPDRYSVSGQIVYGFLDFLKEVLR